MLAQPHRVRLTVRVPRGAAGDVEGGVREVVEGVDGVARAEVERLRGVRPDALDLYVDADVAVAFEPDATADGHEPEAHLTSGFGVLTADVDAPRE